MVHMIYNCRKKSLQQNGIYDVWYANECEIVYFYTSFLFDFPVIVLYFYSASKICNWNVGHKSY